MSHPVKIEIEDDNGSVIDTVAVKYNDDVDPITRADNILNKSVNGKYAYLYDKDGVCIDRIDK